MYYVDVTSPTVFVLAVAFSNGMASMIDLDPYVKALIELGIPKEDAIKLVVESAKAGQELRNAPYPLKK